MEINVITLEDNCDYMIVSAINKGENKYLILAKEESPKDIVLRKVLVEDNKEYLVKLDSEVEFDDVMITFYENYKRKRENDEK